MKNIFLTWLHHCFFKHVFYILLLHTSWRSISSNLWSLSIKFQHSRKIYWKLLTNMPLTNVFWIADKYICNYWQISMTLIKYIWNCRQISVPLTNVFQIVEKIWNNRIYQYLKLNLALLGEQKCISVPHLRFFEMLFKSAAIWWLFEPGKITKAITVAIYLGI